VFVDCFDVAYERATGSAPEQAAPAAAGSGAAPQQQQQLNTAAWAGGWVWPQEQQQQTGSRVDYIPLHHHTGLHPAGVVCGPFRIAAAHLTVGAAAGRGLWQSPLLPNITV
jgi:hypothetical protein